MKTVESFMQFLNAGKKITMVTCYDFWSAQIINSSNIDAVLVGDSAAMVMHGYDTTINANIDMMVAHTAAVSRGLDQKFLIADMPFLSNFKGRNQLVDSVDKLFKAGAQAVKIEGTGNTLNDIEFLVNSGIPVMGHLGMTPQSVHKFGGHKLQGKTEDHANQIFEEAKKLQAAGCFSIVLEMLPANLSKKITKTLGIPTIGIGAGKFTSGQILVLQDLLGMNKDFNPKFLKKYLNGVELIEEALNNYDKDVKEMKFPSKKESY